MARPTGRPVRDEVMDAACVAIQARGVNGFSYADLATQLGVRAPSIHHHFRRKNDLLAETTRRYRSAFRAEVDSFDDLRAIDRLRRYAEVFTSPAKDDLLCLCGAVAADWASIDEATSDEVTEFFRLELAWVTGQLVEAEREGDLRRGIDPHRLATSVLAALEGSLLLARAKLTDRPADAALALLDAAAA